METMLTPFATLVDYRHFRIQNTTAVPNVNVLRVMYRMKSQIDGSCPILETLGGFSPIRLPPFIATTKDALDALKKSERISVLILAYFLKKDSKNTYQAQVNSGTGSSPLAEA